MESQVKERKAYRDWEIVETKVETGGKEDIYSITNNLTGNSVGRVY